MLLPILASADSVEIDGIWYNLVNKLKCAEVIANPSNSHYDGSYTGDIVIPQTVIYEDLTYDVTSINSYAFSYCETMTSVIIPSSISNIGDCAFQYCKKLTSISIPNSVTTIGRWAFHGCNLLNSVFITDLESWLKISFGDSSFPVPHHLFLNGDEIKNLIIPNSITSIGKGSFYGCSWIGSVNIPNTINQIGEEAFWGCSSLTTLTIPNSVTSISFNSFRECSGLTSVSIPSSVTSIGRCAFSDCSSLTSVTIPNSVTSIYAYAFYGCTSLTSVNLGSGIKYIYEESFAKCDELTDVYCFAEKIKDDEYSGVGLYTYPDAFNDSYPQAMTLHVPTGSVEAYSSTEPWSLFKAIVALEGSDIPETKKCATPEISYKDGKLDFTCETEGVEFVSEVTVEDAKKYYDASVTLSQTYKVTVYATKAGHENSDVATREIVIENGQASLFGDLNKDGKVNVADHVKLSDIILNKNE